MALRPRKDLLHIQRLARLPLRLLPKTHRRTQKAKRNSCPSEGRQPGLNPFLRLRHFTTAKDLGRFSRRENRQTYSVKTAKPSTKGKNRRGPSICGVRQLGCRFLLWLAPLYLGTLTRSPNVAMASPPAAPPAMQPSTSWPALCRSRAAS